MNYIIFYLSILLFSCSEDDDIDFTGIYEFVAISDDCADPKDNSQNTRTEDGVCITSSSTEKCLDMIIDINADVAYTLTTKTVTTSGSFGLSLPNHRDRHLYYSWTDYHPDGGLRYRDRD